MHELPPNMNQSSSASQAGPAASGSSVDDLTRIFNSALVGTRVESVRDFSAELYSMIDSPAFRAILGAVRQLGRSQGTIDREAADLLIQTFRKVDRIWSDYLFQEGMDRIKTRG